MSIEDLNNGSVRLFPRILAKELDLEGPWSDMSGAGPHIHTSIATLTEPGDDEEHDN